MSGSLINLSTTKLTECLDNFNALSPALFASPDSSPAFLAGFNTDDVVGPEQVTGMRDKLRSLGIRSDSMLLQGDANAGGSLFGPTNNHAGYDSRFVCDSLNFVDEIMQTGKKVDCGTGTAVDTSGGSTSGGGSGGSGSTPSGGGANANSSIPASGQGGGGNPASGIGTKAGTKNTPTAAQSAADKCKASGGTYVKPRSPQQNGTCQAGDTSDCIDGNKCSGSSHTNPVKPVCATGQVYDAWLGCVSKGNCPAGQYADLGACLPVKK